MDAMRTNQIGSGYSRLRPAVRERFNFGRNDGLAVWRGLLD